MMNNDHYRVFKGVETDAEFAARVRLKYAWWRGDSYYKDEALDAEAWDAFAMQRRIVERTTEPPKPAPRAR